MHLENRDGVFYTMQMLKVLLLSICLVRFMKFYCIVIRLKKTRITNIFFISYHWQVANINNSINNLAEINTL